MPINPTHVKPDVAPAAARILDDLFERGWRWFVDAANPKTGMVLDRLSRHRQAGAGTTTSSVAASGFYLSLLPEAARRALLPAKEAEDRARLTVDFAQKQVDHVNGVLCHFIEWETGKQFNRSEFSILDTSIFLFGCMIAASAYPPLAAICDRLLDRVDWSRLWVQTEAGGPRISYGFDGKTHQPLAATVNVRSSENLMPCVLAAGSRTHPIGQECWYNSRIARSLRQQIDGWIPDPALRQVLNPAHALFTSYFGLAWMNLSGLHDADGIDLWANARLAALLNRGYCRAVGAKRFKTYADAHGGWWGLSAGDSPAGYVARGPEDGDPNGTVWPTAAIASITWMPAELSEDLPRWAKSTAWPKALGQYGLGPFSIDKNWFGDDLLGIDLGGFMSIWANAQANTIHRHWATHWAAKSGLNALDFSHP